MFFYDRFDYFNILRNLYYSEGISIDQYTGIAIKIGRGYAPPNNRIVYVATENKSVRVMDRVSMFQAREFRRFVEKEFHKVIENLKNL